jgi:hypothetical protein
MENMQRPRRSNRSGISLNKNNRQFERQLSRVQMAKTGDREILPSFSQLDFSQLKKM